MDSETPAAESLGILPTDQTLAKDQSKSPHLRTQSDSSGQAHSRAESPPELSACPEFGKLEACDSGLGPAAKSAIEKS